MARINVGVNPKCLTDQHLVAEFSEIFMIVGMLKRDGFVIKGPIPKQFTLGKGHINFFKNKLGYLYERSRYVAKEMTRRGYNVDDSKWVPLMTSFPSSLVNFWQPCQEDSDLVRIRICDRINNPLKAGKTFHRYEGIAIYKETFCKDLLNHELFTV